MMDGASFNLQQILQEMDQALADEVKEQKKHQSTKHSADNGQLLSESNRRYIYTFTLEIPWNIEDDSTITVKFAQTTGQEIKATIIHSTGTTVTIATEKPLPPEALQKVQLIDDSTQLLEKLRDALKNNDEGTAFLGSKSFGLLSYTNRHLLPLLPFGLKFSPDTSQQRAISLALGSEVTYIIGPPGTGKTSTLAAIAFAQLSAGRTVLIAAHTNIAIDNAIMRLVDICNDSGNDTAIQALEAGHLIRYGTPQLEERIKAEYACVHLPTIVSRLSSALHQQREVLQAQVNQLIQLIQTKEQELAEVSRQQQTESQQLISQRVISNERLRLLQERGRIRLANFQAQHHDLTKQRERYQQQVQQVAQQQANKIYQQMQHKAAYTGLLAQINEVESQLLSAQHMNRLQQFFKGISIQKLSQLYADYKQKQWSIEKALTSLQEAIDTLYQERADAEQQVEQSMLAISSLQAQYATPPEEVQELLQLQTLIGRLQQDLTQIDARYTSMSQRCKTILHQAINQRDTLYKQLEVVESALLDTEKKIVAEAQVVATTLAKTYMNSNISSRRFDMVIMDEVSMASLPAVYTVASHADHAVVVIGDPQQLSPIVQAETGSAKEWLGKDLFALRTISLASAKRGRSDSVILTEQARMHPRISAIVRQHIYQGLLNDSPLLMHNRVFHQYNSVEPLPGLPVCVCDTSDASPIATRPEGRSRINAYHTLCVIELARQVLATLPERQIRKGEFRIGLVTPYSKQAQLLQQLVKDMGLTDVIRAGTVHRFQGLEAEVIIFDTVESPGAPPSRLTKGIWGSDAMRLTNVAMTRAKHKLIVVANYSHLQRCLAEHDTLRLTVQDAYKAGAILSSRFLRLASSTLSHSTPQQSGSAVEQDGDASMQNRLLNPEFLDETTFFPRLEQDIVSASKEVIIFSPFLKKGRTQKLAPLLKQRRQDGIAITVVCRSEDTDLLTTEAEHLLRNAGVQIRPIDDINHEKFVFIDDEIAYIGSLNTLSQRNSTEFMERVKSPSYVHSLKQFKQVDSKVKAPSGPPIIVAYDELPKTSKTVCVCGDKLIRKKNRTSQQPFYGCASYPSSSSNHNTENPSEQHLSQIKRLLEMKCAKCGKSTSIQNSNVVCTDEVICGYRQPIKYSAESTRT